MMIFYLIMDIIKEGNREKLKRAEAALAASERKRAEQGERENE